MRRVDFSPRGALAPPEAPGEAKASRGLKPALHGILNS